MWKGKKDCGLSANVVNYKFWNRKEFPVLDAASLLKLSGLRELAMGPDAKEKTPFV